MKQVKIKRITLSFRFDGNGFGQIDDSKYDHKYTTLGSYQGRPFVTGSRDPYNVKTEIMSTSSLKWGSAPDYPFAGRQSDGDT